MPSIKIRNFKYGLDTRKSELEAQPGTLVTLTNAIVNQGGEIEKRKKFGVQVLPANTFGAQSTLAGVVIFGSEAPLAAVADQTSGAMGEGVYKYRIVLVAATGDHYCTLGATTIEVTAPENGVTLSNIPTGAYETSARKIYRTIADGETFYFLTEITDNATTTYIDLSADGTLTDPFAVSGVITLYQRLQHPAVLEGVNYDASLHAMSKAIYSEIYGGLAMVIAEFADGNRYMYYDGVLVEDITAGTILAHLVGDNERIAKHLARLLNLTEDYTGDQIIVESTNYSWSGGVVTVSAPQHGLAVGLPKLKVTTTGVAPFTVTNVDLTVEDSATLSYPLASNPGGGGTTGLFLHVNLVDITGQIGVEFVPTVTVQTEDGAFTTPVAGATPTSPNEGTPAKGSFAVMGGSIGDDNLITKVTIGTAGNRAWSRFTSDGGNFDDGDTITIGTGGSEKIYTIRDVIAVEGDVLRDTTTSPPAPPPVPPGTNTDWRGAGARTLLNLVAAINHDTTVGIINVKYISAAAHTTVYAEGPLPLDLFPGNPYLTVYARTSGAAGNAIPTSTVSDGTWDGATLHDGSGTFTTEVLGSPIAFQEDNETTANALAQAINNSSLVTGFTAVLGTGEEANRVVIISDDLTENEYPNGFAVVVTTTGNVCIGNCVMTFAVSGTGATVTSLRVGGVVVAADVPFSSTLAQGYADLAGAINVGTGTHGILAYAAASFIRISKAITSSADGNAAVDLELVNMVVSFDEPIVIGPSALAVQVPEQVTDTGSGRTWLVGTSPVIATPTGGSGSYTSYRWRPETPGADIVWGDTGYSQVRFAPVSPTYAATLFSLTLVDSTFIWNFAKGNYSSRFVCEVTDSLGTTVTSNTVTITFTLV